MTAADLFAEGSFESAIARRGEACGVRLDAEREKALATHARAVLAANARLHLTTVVEPEEFLERHFGEAFEGAALLGADVAGTHVDIGSGNGYPALPIAVACPSLHSYLVEASRKKAEFLSRAVASCGVAARVTILPQQVQRAADLSELGPLRLLTMRAVGGWSRLVPKLAPALAPDGWTMIWAGDEMDSVRRRVAWRKLELVNVRKLPAMDRTSIWVFRRADQLPWAPS